MFAAVTILTGVKIPVYRISTVKEEKDETSTFSVASDDFHPS